MNYNLKNQEERQIAVDKFNHYVDKMKVISLTQKRNNRSDKQNRSLHKYFMLISDELNEMGLEYNYNGLMVEAIPLMYSPELVKEFIWRPIQKALFDIESTTKLDTHKINQIIDVITKFFGERGVLIEFPSMESLEKSYD